MVTEFEFRLHHVGPVVQMSLSFWDLDHGPQAFREIQDQARNNPDDIAIFLAAMNAPPAPFVPLRVLTSGRRASRERALNPIGLDH